MSTTPNFAETLSNHTPQNACNIIETFRDIIGSKHVLTDKHKTKPYRTGYRTGSNDCLAVLRPGSLVELWHLLQVCAQHDVIVIMQAANTGLTAGSTPSAGYDREVVVISTRRLTKIHYLDTHKQVVCFPGSSLHKLEATVKPHNREPHSVIGSSCLGASVIGGVCNNSGGSLVERGPAYTELSLFAQIDENRNLKLVNNLGIDLGSSPEEILHKLETGQFSSEDIKSLDHQQASDREYKDWVRDIDAPTPARYNADPRRLKEASGCAGKVAVFAVRLDTFPSNTHEQTFFIGTNETDVLTSLRRTILSEFTSLPVSAEYMHQDMFTLTETYGRDTVNLVRFLGTSALPSFFVMKERINSRMAKMPIFNNNPVDHLLHYFSKLMPNPLPKSIQKIGHEFKHLLILKMRGDSIEQTTQFLQKLERENKLTHLRCTPQESKLISLHRFAAAGAAIRYQTLYKQQVGSLLALDIALPRNKKDWFEKLPDSIEAKILKKLYYGHFMCHVFHQDYILQKGADHHQVKSELLNLLANRGAKYPAEHNVGHLYTAEQTLIDHYQSLDPTNSFNPGIGHQSKLREHG